MAWHDGGCEVRERIEGARCDEEVLDLSRFGRVHSEFLIIIPDSRKLYSLNPQRLPTWMDGQLPRTLLLEGAPDLIWNLVSRGFDGNVTNKLDGELFNVVFLYPIQKDDRSGENCAFTRGWLALAILNERQQASNRF